MRKTDKFPADVRRNWGWWDGRADGLRGRQPMWGKAHVYRCRHPHDDVYGQAYWQGWYGEDHPNTKLSPAAMTAAGWGNAA